MAYKLPIDEEKFIKAIKKDDEIKAEDPIMTSKELKHRLDYFIDLMDRYRGKTLKDIAEDKYSSEYLKQDTTSDEQLYDMAKVYADTIKGEKSNEIITENKSEVNALTQKEQETRQKGEQKIQKIDENYQQMQEDSKNGAIKSGIARSSILTNLLKAQEGARQTEKQNVKDLFQVELDEINGKIKILEQNLKDSLANLDMESAINLNDELTRLKDERDKRNQEIALHNQKVDNKIANYAKELSKTEDGKAIVDFIETGSGKYYFEAKRTFSNYIDSLPIDEAYQELEKEYGEKLFGEKTIKDLKDYLKRKEEYYRANGYIK